MKLDHYPRLAAIRQEWAGDIARCCDNWQDEGWDDHRCQHCGASEMTHEIRIILIALESEIRARQQVEQEAKMHKRRGDINGLELQKAHERAEGAEQQVTALTRQLEELKARS